MGTSRAALTAHVVINPQQLTAEGLSRDQLLILAQQQLARLGVRKSTLQLETIHPVGESVRQLAPREH
ncbi:MAG: hypothetical protein RLZZ54_1522 [Cyanobacteriota bacterium]